MLKNIYLIYIPTIAKKRSIRKKKCLNSFVLQNHLSFINIMQIILRLYILHFIRAMEKKFFQKRQQPKKKNLKQQQQNLL